jgi:hypothetical protein
MKIERTVKITLNEEEVDALAKLLGEITLETAKKLGLSTAQNNLNCALYDALVQET